MKNKCAKCRNKDFLHSQALRGLLEVLWLHSSLAFPAVRLAQTPSARQSRPRVRPPPVQGQGVQEVRGGPEPLALLCCRGNRSQNYPKEEGRGGRRPGSTQSFSFSLHTVCASLPLNKFNEHTLLILLAGLIFVNIVNENLCCTRKI